MNKQELSPQPPSPEKEIKERALAVHRKLVEHGLTSPGEWDMNDPEITEAQRLYDAWEAQLEDTARSHFEITTFYVEAGCTDPHYLNYTLSWLLNDAGDLGKDSDDAELSQLRKEYADKMRKIREMLGQTETE